MAMNEVMQAKQIYEAEKNFHGITVAYLNDEKDTLLEAPLDKERTFMILNF